MNIEDDFFDFESSSMKDFSEAIEIPKRNHITIVWHEMGHFIGNKIAPEFWVQLDNLFSEYSIKL